MIDEEIIWYVDVFDGGEFVEGYGFYDEEEAYSYARWLENKYRSLDPDFFEHGAVVVIDC